MGLFDFLKKSKRKEPENHRSESSAAKKPDAQYLRIQEILDKKESIYIGWQHISGPVHISCEVRYVPSEGLVIASTSSSDEPTPRYEAFQVPEDIKNAKALIGFIQMRGPWLHIGYELSPQLEQKINDTFPKTDAPVANGVIVPCCGKPVPVRYSYCPYCGRRIDDKSNPCHVEEDRDATVWLCSQCGSDNSFAYSFCGTCGRKR